MVRDWVFSSAFRNKGKLYTPIIAIYCPIGGCSQCNKEREKMQRLKKKKLSCFYLQVT